MQRRILSLVLLAGTMLSVAAAQPDPLSDANQRLHDATSGIFSLTFEERTRWEEKYGVSFGKAVNQQDMLSRLRIGAQIRPMHWLKFSVMGQDARAPFYGVPAPNTLRDTIDLHEAYVELNDQQKTGPGATFGREMLVLGEGRLIGSPQWGNLSRTFDVGRVYQRTPHARFELLMVSPVKVLPDQFNKPELGERIWGTYDTFQSLWHGASVDVYALRHSENKIGGWSSPGTLGTDSFGARLYGPIVHKLTYSLEGVGQTGHSGLVRQRAYAWFAGMSKNVSVGRPLTLSAEYKVASGTPGGQTYSSTFDQLSPANHDKFGQQDLFGWRNLRTFKSLETVSVTKSFAINAMYTDHWLDRASDALFNSQGGVIAQSKAGTAGRHVGQELDAFLTYTHAHHLFGAGFGHFFKGEFIAHTTPNVNPRYLYIFQQYSFK